jgi:cytoskeletal protein CcmA (bactofilin family)
MERSLTSLPFRFLKRLLAMLSLSALSIGLLPATAVASSWDPTLLVNTESFQIIDDGDGTSNIYLQFGDTAAEQILWQVAQSRFAFTDDVHIEGNVTVTGDITASGSLKINDDDTGNAILSFGNSVTTETLTFDATNSRFDFSDDILVQGTAAVTGNITGSGNLKIESTIAQDGDTFTINQDQSAGNAAVTFGNQSGNQTITYNDTNDRFDVSDDVNVTGTVEASTNVIAQGNLSGDTLTVSSDAVNINGIQYYFDNAQGGAGQVLTNDGAGNLTWQNSALGNGSGLYLSLHPEYPNAVYSPDGSANVGQMTLERSGSDNVFAWRTSRSADQDYDIITRIQVPQNFDSWATNGIVLRYRTGLAATANNTVTLTVLDTAGSTDFTSVASASTSFANLTATSADLNGTYTAGGYVTIQIKLLADSTASAVAMASNLNIQWATTTP